MKMDRNFRAFIGFMSLKLEVPTICLVTVTAREKRPQIRSIIVTVGVFTRCKHKVRWSISKIKR